MNKEVIKAMKKNDRKGVFIKADKWFIKNEYKIYKVVFFPIWLVQFGIYKYNQKANKRNAWNEEKANEILNYYIPRKSKWNEENNSFYFFNNVYGWGIHSAKRYLKRKDRRFWKINARRIRNYLINDFELEGFIKENLETSSWTEIKFELK